MIVEIDEETLAEYGQWPWPRTLVAELATRIAEHEPAAIGFDMLFPEPDRFSPAEIRASCRCPKSWRSAWSACRATTPGSRSRSRTTRWCSPWPAWRSAEPRGSPPLREYGKLLLESCPRSTAQPPGAACISSTCRERLVRRVPLVARVGDTPVPALALELWRVGTGAHQFSLSDAGNGLLSVEFAGASVPVQRDGSMWLRYSRHDPTRFVSASSSSPARPTRSSCARSSCSSASRASASSTTRRRRSASRFRAWSCTRS